MNKKQVRCLEITSKPKPNQYFFFPDTDSGGWTEAQCVAKRDRWREGRKGWFVEEESKEKTLSAVT